MNHKDQIDAIARDWANDRLPLYEALYAAYELGYEHGAEGGYRAAESDLGVRDG